jgi:hypothetical protein
MPIIEPQDLEFRKEAELKLKEIKQKFRERRNEILNIIAECFGVSVKSYGDDIPSFLQFENSRNLENNQLCSHSAYFSHSKVSLRLSLERDFRYTFPLNWFTISDEEIKASLVEQIEVRDEKNRAKQEKSLVQRERKKSEKQALLERLSPEEKKLLGIKERRKR